MTEPVGRKRWGFRKPFAIAVALALTLSLLELLLGARVDGDFIVLALQSIFGLVFWAYVIVRVRNHFVLKRKTK